MVLLLTSPSSDINGPFDLCKQPAESGLAEFIERYFVERKVGQIIGVQK